MKLYFKAKGDLQIEQIDRNLYKLLWQYLGSSLISSSLVNNTTSSIFKLRVSNLTAKFVFQQDGVHLYIISPISIISIQTEFDEGIPLGPQ